MKGTNSEIDASSSVTVTPDLEVHQANIDAFINATKQGQLDLMQQLYHPGYLNAFNSRKSLNALLLAARQQHNDVVIWLLAQDGINLNVKDGYFERTPLIKALINGCDDATLLAFINHPNIDLNLRSPLEGSALTLATYYEEWEIAQAILDKLTAYSDNDHPCALICAVRAQEPNLNFIQLLLESGADPDWHDNVEIPEHLYRDVYLYSIEESPFQQADAGLSAIEVAVKYKKRDCLKLLRDAQLLRKITEYELMDEFHQVDRGKSAIEFSPVLAADPNIADNADFQETQTEKTSP